ncbi:hypothetical protein GCM10023224_18730 [Streptomonospora halophila]|uniref:Uncharacterized protein n=1 Tax=Streptomonospora halophila TaxID=427369 RepID=A0ABP9GGB4_9ACTN
MCSTVVGAGESPRAAAPAGVSSRGSPPSPGPVGFAVFAMLESFFRSACAVNAWLDTRGLSRPCAPDVRAGTRRVTRAGRWYP